MLKKLESDKFGCVIPNIHGDIALRVSNVSKSYNNKEKILENINIEIPVGKILTILGETGSGKTTILRMIAGFEMPNSGEIIIGHQYAFKGYNVLPPEGRGIGILFQNTVLFPHMTVIKNVEFAISHLPKKIRKTIINNIIESLNIGHLLNRYPFELSGGQQQKVAIARILALRPKVILFDEPFNHLDSCCIAEIKEDIRRVVKEHKLAALMVSHNQEEAFSISDQIGILHNNTIAQVGNPKEIYETPKNIYIAKMTGKTNIICGHIDGLKIKGDFGEVPFEHICTNIIPQNTCQQILIRPENICIGKNIEPSFHLGSTIKDVRFFGMYSELTLQINESMMLHSTIFSNTNYYQNEKVYISFKRIHIIT